MNRPDQRGQRLQCEPAPMGHRLVPRLGAWLSWLCGAGVIAACDVATVDDEPVLETSAQAVTLSQVTSFGTNPGILRMFVYVPPGLPAGAPLVVALHGCTQSAAVYSTQTQWGELADRL